MPINTIKKVLKIAQTEGIEGLRAGLRKGGKQRQYPAITNPRQLLWITDPATLLAQVGFSLRARREAF